MYPCNLIRAFTLVNFITPCQCFIMHMLHMPKSLQVTLHTLHTYTHKIHVSDQQHTEWTEDSILTKGGIHT